jgi:hypothetical protein
MQFACGIPVCLSLRFNRSEVAPLANCLESCHKVVILYLLFRGVAL